MNAFPQELVVGLYELSTPEFRKFVEKVGESEKSEVWLSPIIPFVKKHYEEFMDDMVNREDEDDRLSYLLAVLYDVIRYVRLVEKILIDFAEKNGVDVSDVSDCGDVEIEIGCYHLDSYDLALFMERLDGNDLSEEDQQLFDEMMASFVEALSHFFVEMKRVESQQDTLVKMFYGHFYFVAEFCKKIEALVGPFYEVVAPTDD